MSRLCWLLTNINEAACQRFKALTIGVTEELLSSEQLTKELVAICEGAAIANWVRELPSTWFAPSTPTYQSTAMIMWGMKACEHNGYLEFADEPADVQ